MLRNYIGIPYVDMRDRVHGEVVSQALFAEEVLISRFDGGHFYITTSDGYSGYAPSSAVIQLEKPYLPSVWTNLPSVPIYRQPTILNGPYLFLPYGVGVKVLSLVDEEWAQIELPGGESSFAKRGYLKPHHTLTQQELEPFARQFLGLPYIWGGRTSFGYDCSGFVQMLYGQMGIFLPRDSYQQVQSPLLKEQAQESLQVGDLIFWGKSLENIRHVGCFFGEGRFIHATSKEGKPWLRISSLTDSAWEMGALFAYRTFRTIR